MKKIVFCLLLSLFTARATNAQKAPTWELGTSIGIMEPNVEALMKAASENGFKYVEAVMSWYMHTDIDEIVRQVKDYRRLANQYGLTIWSVHLPFGAQYDLSTIDPVARERCKQYLIVSLELAKGFGPFREAVLHTSAEPVSNEERALRIKTLNETLKEFAPFVEAKYHCRLAIENLPRTCLGNSADEMLAILNDVPSADICFDTNHILKEKTEYMAEKISKHIKTLHVSDYDQIDERHWLPGKGVVNWNKLIDVLLQTGYEGPFMFEVRLIGEYAENADLYMSDIAKSWEMLKKNYIDYKKT